MSLFSWFSRKKPSSRPRPAVEPAGLLDADATVPLMPGRSGKPAVLAAPADHAANRKNERMERRELLYTVVRDAMVRASVLSAGYKFKVLSLDQRGRQFLVMIDLGREYGGETARLSEIEALIAQTAKSRFDILVTAVYWRINDHVAVGVPGRGAAHPPIAPSHAGPAPGQAHPKQGPASAPAPLLPPRTAPTPTHAPVHAAPVAAESVSLLAPREIPPSPASYAPVEGTRSGAAAGKGYDPIDADEVAAFRRALGSAAATGRAQPAASVPGTTVRSGPLLPPAPSAHGVEDTEMSGHDRAASDLSNTQYGELR
ncbi:hypothetical protein QRO11_00155 [Paracidovorax citrulli]|uniref:Uncharacterized protein n=2 Tax=Paracidovorax citrulli TaxID=80869 RepID=A1TWI2_PARC0|nr:hypothetical protein [Paracidovorax citrulli]ABM35320.1 conserved hypothetical protein [Paracidovorax citrulli AAC00-1]ATG96185.1 hypothetical protein CQB05_20895 [Paracidovorax citrulli]PVY64777.1 hypothetical protein C8E08_2117 [Paracidovorax citrulli]QCX10680.1 hypothetical protein APS58_1824 [Paracidovorax citrulli]REG71026.1 hypothetical protein C8E07_4253 [Paracidovorax citrulli]